MRKLLCIILLLSSLVGRSQSIDILFDRAETSMAEQQWDKAIAEFNQLLEQTSISDAQKANVYNNLGYAFLQLSDYTNAKQFLDKSVEIHETIAVDNPLDFALTLQNLGILYVDVAEFDLALKYLKKAIVLVESNSKDPLEIARTKDKIGRLYEEAGMYQEAIEIYQENYELFAENEGATASDIAEFSLHLGRILLKTGKPFDAEVYIKKSVSLYETFGGEFITEKAEAIETLGLYNEEVGRLADAEKNLVEALRLKRSDKNIGANSIVETLNNLGILYQELGDLEKSKNKFKEVIKECKQRLGVEHPFYATAVNNLATIEISQGSYEEAKELLLESLQTYESIYGEDHPLAANALNNLARVERRMGNYVLAESYYERVLQIDEHIYGKEHPDYATTLLNLGILNSVLGNEEKAENFFLECINIRMSVLGQRHPAFASALEGLGMHYLSTGKLVESEIYFKVALDIQVEQLNSVFPVLTEQERELFYLTMKEDVERYNFIAFSLLEENPELVKNIFDFQIKTKAVLFNSSSKVRSEVEGANDLIKQKYQDWQKQKRLLTNLHMMGYQELAERNIDIKAVEEQVEQMEKDLVLNVSNFQTLFHNKNENWEGVQELVEADEAIVEIIRIREFKSQVKEGTRVFGFTDFTKYLAIIFNKSTTDAPTYAILGDDFKTEEVWYAKYRNSFRFNIANDDSFETLWSAVHDKIGNVDRVRVSPDGIFYKINPNAMMLPSGKYVIDEYFVSYLTSCKDLFRAPVENVNSRSFLFGNPAFAKTPAEDEFQLPVLPESETEIKEVSTLLENNGWSSRTYIGERATETSIRSAVNPTVLHIATHGYFGDVGNFIGSRNQINDPLFKSGLFLANVNDTYKSYLNNTPSLAYNDGILTAYEAMNLNLSKTRLVVLSACESGLGDVKNGEGVFGLQRAFMVAGARNLITSLIKVEDAATKELMVSFYENLTKNQEIGTSLRKAQLKMKEKYRNPSIWGAFMLIGNG